jgi:type IV secretion system protein VirB1
LRAAFSCYYSGNFTRGFRADKAGQPSYVQKVVANADVQVPPIPVVPAIRPQGADGAVAVRPAARALGRTGTSIKPVEAPTPWVIFALSAQQETPATQADVATVKEAPAKVRRGVPSGDPAAEHPTAGKAQTVPMQPAAPSGNSQNTPFVQFVD